MHLWITRRCRGVVVSAFIPTHRDGKNPLVVILRFPPLPPVNPWCRCGENPPLSPGSQHSFFRPWWPWCPPCLCVKTVVVRSSSRPWCRCVVVVKIPSSSSFAIFAVHTIVVSCCSLFVEIPVLCGLCDPCGSIIFICAHLCTFCGYPVALSS